MIDNDEQQPDTDTIIQCSNSTTQHIIQQLLIQVHKHGVSFIDTVIQRSAGNNKLLFLTDTNNIDHQYWLYQLKHSITESATRNIHATPVSTINTIDRSSTQRKRRRFTDVDDAAQVHSSIHDTAQSTATPLANQFLSQLYSNTVYNKLVPLSDTGQQNNSHSIQHTINNTSTVDSAFNVDVNSGSDNDDDLYEPSSIDRHVDRSDLSPVNRSWSEYNGNQLVQQTYHNKHHLSYYAQNNQTSGTSTALNDSNIGYRVLVNMGWIPGTALGRYRTGIIEPINTQQMNKHTVGLGESEHQLYNNSDIANSNTIDANVDSYRQYRANMTTAYNNRQQINRH